MSLLRAVVTLCLMGLASCASVDRQDYPAGWPPPAPAAAGCPLLDGTYANHGQGRVARPLSSWLIEGSALAQAPVDRVRLAGPRGGQLAVSLLDAQGRLLAARHWREGTDYHCSDGMLVVSRSEGLTMVGLAMSVQARLVPAADGALVVETREAGGGVILLVPYAGAYRYWSLFPAAPSP